MLKKYWQVGVLIGGLIVFGSRLEAMWKAPEDVEEQKARFDQFITQQSAYTAAQEERNDKYDQWYENQQRTNEFLIELINKEKST